MRVHKEISDISKKVVANANILFKVFGAISILFGIILKMLLFFQHY